MGQRGARSAREVASIVLLDDNFGSVVAAIAEGRTLFDNLRLSFQYLLLIHLPLVLTATFIPLAGYPVLYLPIHIVWAEAIIHPTALLAFQRSGIADTTLPATRGSDVRLFSRFEWATILFVGTLIAALVGATYLRSMADGEDHARAMAMIALTTASASITITLSQLRTRASRFVVAVSLALAVVLVQVPALASLLHLRPLHLDDWALAVAGGAAAMVPLLLARRIRR